MRRVKLKFSPSLEQDDIQNQLEQALSEEKKNEKVTEAELEQPLNNKQGFDAQAAEDAADSSDSNNTDEVTFDASDDAVDTSTEVTETDTTDTTDVPDEPAVVQDDSASTDETVDAAPTEDVVADTTTDSVDSEGGEITDVIAEQVVRQSSGEENQGVKAFASKISESYSLAQSKGFAGTFDEFLTSLTETITAKESEVVQNPLGTTSGSGDLVEPDSTANALDESDSAAVTDDVTSTDETASDSTTDTDVIDSTAPTDTEVSEDGSDPAEAGSSDTTDTTDDSVADEFSDSNTDSDTTVDNTDSTDTTDGETTDTPEASETDTADTSEASDSADANTNLNGEPSFDDTDTSTDNDTSGEEDDNVPEPEGDDDESLNEYMDEIDDEQEEIDDTDTMVSEAEDSSTRLGRIAEIVQDAIQEAKEGDSEDVNESLTKIAEIANECYATRYGIERKFKIMISNEALLEAITPIERAQIALESAKEVLKSIGQAILKAIEAIAQWVQEQWRNFQLKSGVLEKRLNKLEAQLDKVQTDPEKKDIKNAALFDALNIGGQISNVAQNVDAVAKLASTVYSTISEWTFDSAQALLNVTEKSLRAGVGRVLAGFQIPSYGSFGLGPVSNPVAEGYLNDELKDSIRVAIGTELPGNKTLVLYAPQPDEGGEKDNYLKALRANKFGVVLADYRPNEEIAKSDSISTLTLAEMKALVASLKKLFTAIKDYNNVQPKANAIRNKVKVYAGRLSRLEGFSRETSSQSLFTEAAGVYRAVVRIINEPSVSFTNYSLKLITANIRYIQLSLGSVTQTVNQQEPEMAAA